jgi:chromosome partitioning protein
MSYTILVANSKGGVGKTTTAVTLAHALAQLGQETLLIDLDAQGHVAISLGVPGQGDVYELLARDEIRITPSGRKNLSLIVGDSSTAAAIKGMAQEFFPHLALQKALRPIHDQFDFVLFDTPPGISLITVAAMIAASHVLVPVACEPLALHGIGEYVKALHEAQEAGARCELAWVVPTFYDRVTNATHRTLEAIVQIYQGTTTAPIPRETVVRDASDAQQTIWEYAPRSRSAKAYAQLVKRVLDATGVAYG